MIGRLLRGDAAIDDKTGAGHETGIVGGEEHDALGMVRPMPDCQFP